MDSSREGFLWQRLRVREKYDQDFRVKYILEEEPEDKDKEEHREKNEESTRTRRTKGHSTQGEQEGQEGKGDT